MSFPEVSIVIPCFNEEENIELLVSEIKKVLDNYKFEIIFVDDASYDRTFEILSSISKNDPKVRVYKLVRRMGQSAALWVGFRMAQGRFVVTLDADLQNDPKDIPKILSLLEEFDMVSGVRVSRKDSLFRKIASRIANSVRNFIIGDPVSDVGCSLKGYKKELVQKIPFFKNMHRFIPALVIKIGGKIAETEVTHRPRMAGKSKYGILDRLLEGLYDLWGVRWFLNRWDVIEFVEAGDNDGN